MDADKRMQLKEHRSLVTGGASGLGLAIVERFVAEGARVTVLDRNAERLEMLKLRLGDQVEVVAGDVRSLADNRRAVAAAVASFGGLDSFVGNAGIWDFNMSLLDLPDDRVDAAFDEVFGVNVKGYMLGAKAAALELVRSGGSIVFTLSNAAFYPAGGGPLYTAAKHAAHGLVRELAYELAPRVRVNAVAPGIIPTDLRGARALDQEEQSVAAIFPPAGASLASPLGVVPRSEDYTGPYVLLVSNADASTITGAVINADGGLGIRGLRSANGGSHLLELVTNGNEVASI
jgi:NAD(P)-dependent dehydrogenase (short-subunit alcohol dehydrogenase family)